MTEKEKYLAAGFKLLPSGQLNEHLWNGYKYGNASAKDPSWIRTGSEKRLGYVHYFGYHKCCGSKRAYRHKAKCPKILAIKNAPEDLSDLKDI